MRNSANTGYTKPVFPFNTCNAVPAQVSASFLLQVPKVLTKMRIANDTKTGEKPIADAFFQVMFGSRNSGASTVVPAVQKNCITMYNVQCKLDSILHFALLVRTLIPCYTASHV